jgi:hypothetical protein
MSMVIQHIADPAREGKGLCGRAWKKLGWHPFKFECEHCIKAARKRVWVLPPFTR